MYDSIPTGEFRIFESYMRAFALGAELIYIENQFLWSPELVSVIADKLRNPPTPRLPGRGRCCPRRPTTAPRTRAGQVGVLLDADDGGQRVLAATTRSLSPSRDRADPLYVHAKVAVVDDRWLIVGSANINAHSFFNDTEMCVATDDAALARDTRVRLWAEHLELDEDEVASADAGDLVDSHWRPIAREQLERSRAGSVRRTGCSSCPACRAARVACSARSPGCSTTADRPPALEPRLLDDG